MNQRVVIVRVSLLIVLVILPVAASARPPNGDTDPAVLTRHLIHGMISQRERLKTGVFHATGKSSVVTVLPKPLEGEVRVYCAFDYDQGLYRFDRSEPGLVTRVEGPPTSKEDDPNKHPRVTKAEVYSFKSIRTPAGMTWWVSGSGDHQAVVQAPGKRLPPQIGLFDIRALGVADTGSLERHVMFSEIAAVLLSRPPAKVSQDGPHVWRIDWHVLPKNGPTIVRTSLWVDESNFTPIRLEHHNGKGPTEASGWEPPMMVSEVAWREINQVWVPKTFSIKDVKRNGVNSCDLDLMWESVNQPVPAKVFTVEGLELKKGTQIVDTQLGKPIITSVVGGGPIPPIIEPPGHRPSWHILAVAAVVLTALAAVIVYRHRRKAAVRQAS